MTKKLRRWKTTQPQNLARGLNQAGVHLQRGMRLKIKSQLTGKRGGTNKRTGQFMRSIKWHVGNVGKKKPFLKVGSDAPFAVIREKGGTIRARSVTYLTIPFPGITGTAREYDNTFVVTTLSGFKFIAQKRGGKLRPLFSLKKSVQHPRQPWFKPSVKQNIRTALKKIQFELNRTLKR